MKIKNIIVQTIIALGLLAAFVPSFVCGQANVAQSAAFTYGAESSSQGPVKTLTIDELRAAAAAQQQARALADVRPGNPSMTVTKAYIETDYPLTAGDNNVPASLLSVSCSGGDVRVNSITLQSDTPNANQFLKNIKFSLGGVQSTTAQLVERNGLYVARFNTRFTCSQNSSNLLRVTVDVSTAAIYHSIRIGVGEITPAGNTNLSVLPVYGGVHSIVGFGHGPGSNVVDANGNIWKITNDNGGTRRMYTSIEAFLTYPFNSRALLFNMNSYDAALYVDDPFLPQEGRVYADSSEPLHSPYLVSLNVKLPFNSPGLPAQFGFPGPWLQVDLNNTWTGYIIASPIERHPRGVVIYTINGGQVFFVTSNGRAPIQSLDAYISYWGPELRIEDIKPETPGDQQLPTEPSGVGIRPLGQNYPPTNY